MYLKSKLAEDHAAAELREANTSPISKTSLTCHIPHSEKHVTSPLDLSPRSKQISKKASHENMENTNTKLTDDLESRATVIKQSANNQQTELDISVNFSETKIKKEIDCQDDIENNEPKINTLNEAYHNEAVSSKKIYTSQKI